MPLYEYHCKGCGNFEIIRKFSDAPLSACPTCSGAVEKLLSAPAIQFKGTGWYITDYARKSSAKDNSSAAKDSSGDSSGDSSSSSTPTKTPSKEGAATGSSTTK